MTNMLFRLIGEDRLTRILDRAALGADGLARHINQASDDSNQALGNLVRGADGRLRDVNGRFASTGAAARQLGDDIDGGSRRGGLSLRGLMDAVRGAASSAAGALPSLGSMGGALQGVGAAAGITALPAIGALVPMLAGAGTAAITAKLAFSGVGEAAALAGKDSKAYHKALQDMGPEQAEFTKALVAGKEEFAGLGKEVQKIVLPSFTRALKDAGPVIDIVKGGVKEMAGVFADLGDTFGELFGSNKFQDALRTNMGLGAAFIGQVTEPLGKFTQSLLDFGAASGPTLQAFAQGIGDLLGKGLPGFFEGLKGGIAGSAEMFRGLFDAVNKILPALGEFAGAVANAAGPALREIFESAGTTASGALTTLAGAAKYLKPVFGELGGAARVMSITLGAIGGIAKNVGKVVIESLWPSFREAENAVGPMQRLATRLKTNQAAVQEFTRVASNGIIDFVGVTISQLPNVIAGFRIMATGTLTGMDAIVSGATHAFGWIPGLGPKLKTANREFDRFKDGFISSLQSAEDQSRTFADRVGPRLSRNKLKMNIDNWNSQIAIAKQKLSDKNLPPSKKAKLLADIADLQRKVHTANRELDSFDGRHATASITIATYYKNGKRPGAGTVLAPEGRAAGGRVFGPGTGTSDDVPIMASNGEYVVNAAATQRNLSLLEAINSGRTPRVATGGGSGGLPTLGRAAAGPAGGGTINVYITVADGADPLGAARKIYKRLLELKNAQGGAGLGLG